MGPSKSSIYNSSLDSVQLISSDQLQCGIIGVKLLPVSMQALHSLVFARVSRWMYGQHMLTGCLRELHP